MNMPKIAQLRAIKAFSEHGTVEKAAESLNLSQPGLSHQLRALERDVESVLFEKVGRRLCLTPSGRALVEASDDVFQSLQRAVDVTRSREGSQLVRVGALPTLGVYILAPALAALSKTHAFEPSLIYGAAPDQLSDLVVGELDVLAGVGTPPVQENIIARVLGIIKPVWISTNATSRCISRDALRHQRFVSYGNVNDYFFNGVAELARSLQLNTVATVTHMQTIKMLVAEGMGGSILPNYTVTEYNLIAQQIEDTELEYPVWLATRRSALNAKSIRRLFEYEYIVGRAAQA